MAARTKTDECTEVTMDVEEKLFVLERKGLGSASISASVGQTAEKVRSAGWAVFGFGAQSNHR